MKTYLEFLNESPNEQWNSFEEYMNQPLNEALLPSKASKYLYHFTTLQNFLSIMRTDSYQITENSSSNSGYEKFASEFYGIDPKTLYIAFTRDPNLDENSKNEDIKIANIKITFDVNKLKKDYDLYSFDFWEIFKHIDENDYVEPSIRKLVAKAFYNKKDLNKNQWIDFISEYVNSEKYDEFEDKMIKYRNFRDTEQEERIYLPDGKIPNISKYIKNVELLHNIFGAIVYCNYDLDYCDYEEMKEYYENNINYTWMKKEIPIAYELFIDRVLSAVDYSQEYKVYELMNELIKMIKKYRRIK